MPWAGRQGTREKLKQASDHQHEDDFFKQVMTFDNLPAERLAEADGMKLLVVGKIKEFGEGCACMIGGISRAVLSRLQEKDNEIVLIDAEAGLEHFGRQVDKSCDLVICIVDPNYESIQMAGRARQIAEGAGIQTYFILNKVDDDVRGVMTEGLDRRTDYCRNPPQQRDLSPEPERAAAYCPPCPRSKSPTPSSTATASRCH